MKRFSSKKVLSFIYAGIILLSGCTTGVSNSQSNSNNVLPLQEFFGVDPSINLSGVHPSGGYADELKLRAEILASCMNAEGFKYPDVDKISAFKSFEFEYGSRQFVEKYGFGITTLDFSQEMAGPDLVGHKFEEFMLIMADVNKKLENYINSLTEAERDEYDKAFYGYSDQVVFSKRNTDVQLESDPGAGCHRAADNFSYESHVAFKKEFRNELDILYQEVEQDPRLLASRKQTIECVEENGLDGSVSDLYDGALFDIFEKKTKDLEKEMKVTLSREYTDEEFSNTFRQKLAVIQKEEIETALIFSDCGGILEGKNADLVFKISAEYENSFISENIDRLTQIRDEYPT